MDSSRTASDAELGCQAITTRLEDQIKSEKQVEDTRSHASCTAESDCNAVEPGQVARECAACKPWSENETTAAIGRMYSSRSRPPPAPADVRTFDDRGAWLYSYSFKSMVLVEPAPEEYHSPGECDAVPSQSNGTMAMQARIARRRSRSPEHMGTVDAAYDPDHSVARSSRDTLHDSPPSKRRCTAELAVRSRLEISNPVSVSTEQQTASRKVVRKLEQGEIGVCKPESRESSLPSATERHLMQTLTEAFHPDKLFAARYATPSSAEEAAFSALVEQWRHETHVMFAKLSGYANLRVFPTPPVKARCHRVGCQDLQQSGSSGSLGLCDCQIRRAFKGLSKVQLRGELTRWDPELFSIYCAEGVREDFWSNAVQIIAVVSDMHMEAREDVRILSL
ncbi:hypothetical protein B0A48_17803 [Cryoendolithus antarcticus]|uniref:Uncharacterized protein n=1 Tax=Cryoendolithus antarcticus TaxID=1507870 RepID=A0A1V8SBP9_9PEZI|nr:hypothetical protein B0A48_17803 [Cryoendolithus antarcticus]